MGRQERKSSQFGLYIGAHHPWLSPATMDRNGWPFLACQGSFARECGESRWRGCVDAPKCTFSRCCHGSSHTIPRAKLRVVAGWGWNDSFPGAGQRLCLLFLQKPVGLESVTSDSLLLTFLPSEVVFIDLFSFLLMRVKVSSLEYFCSLSQSLLCNIAYQLIKSSNVYFLHNLLWGD